MPLGASLGDPVRRRALAGQAVADAEAVIRARTGFGAVAARLGLEAINALRPGFLVRQIDELLPALAGAIEPHWLEGIARGNPAGHLEANADLVAGDLLGVTDGHVASAVDGVAIAVYRRLRAAAPARIAENMAHIAAFVERHSPPAR